MGGVIGKVYTYPKGHDLEIEWKIEDFLSFYNDDKSTYNSPSFSFKDIQWNFMIRMDLGPYIQLFLCGDTSSPPIFLHINIALKTLNGQKFRERYFSTTKCDPKYRSLFHPLISKTELVKRKYELLPSDVLTMICTMKLPTSAEIESAVASAKRPLFPSGSRKKRITLKFECPECFNVMVDDGMLLRPVCRKCELAKAEGPPPIVTCYDCKMNVEDIGLHKKKCLNKPIKCPECSSVVLLQDWFDHECQMAIAQGEASTSVSSIFDEKILLDFKELFLTKEDCDVVIKVKDQEFPAHRNILKARSPVFASTFRSGMKEKATSVVKINDCDPSSFSDFLCFLYCGDMRIISKDNVFCLFSAAVKYNVQDLKTKCVEFMNKNLSIDTFCDTCTAALQHSDAGLMKITTNYFTKNAPKIIITPKWQSFLAENPADSNELLVKLLVNNRSSSK